MNGGAYQAARVVAPRIEAYFARHHTASRGRGGDGFAAVPDRGIIEALVEAAFWTSLRREEGYVPRVSLAYVAADDVTDPFRFERPLPLDAGALARVAPAVERPGIHLGVWDDGDGLRVWGTTREIPTLCFVLEVSAPGLLVIKDHRRDESGKFVNVAVLEGDRIKIVDEQASAVSDRPEILAALLGFEPRSSRAGAVDVLVSLAVSMRSHRRGGLLLLVPSGGETWRESMVQPIAYSGLQPFSALGDRLREPSEARGAAWQEAVDEAVDLVAGLTAVDGAAVITDRYELLAFGAKVRRRDGCAQVDRVTVWEPIEGSVPQTVDPGDIGGTRHLAGAQFVQDQRDAIALVASQDGRFTVFVWAPRESTVHAHRVETLLL